MPRTTRPVGRAGGAGAAPPAPPSAKRTARQLPARVGEAGADLSRQAGDGAEHVARVELGDARRPEIGRRRAHARSQIRRRG